MKNPFVLFFLVVLVAAVVIYAYRFIRAHPRRKPDPVYHFKCTGCRQRLAYRASQVGHAGMCHRCKERFIFPPPPTVKR